MSIVGMVMLVIGGVAAAGSGMGAQLAFVLPMAAGALVLAAWVGVFRRDSIVGPARMEPGEPLGGLAVATLMAFVVWVAVPSWYLTSTQTQTQTTTSAPAATTTRTAPAATPSTAPTATTTAGPRAATQATRSGGSGREITPGLLRASVTASGLALGVMLVMNAAVRGGGLRLLGLHSSQIPRGVAMGLLGAVILLGLVLLVSTLTEILWQAIHYEHPREHELLRVLDEHRGDRSVSMLVLLSAWVLAPMFEEVFFRGHVQTLVSYALAVAVSRGKPAGEAPSPLEPPVVNPGAGARWAGVVVASLLFAAMHAPWTTPPIFVLSLCVGYAYERTGSLWVPIVMHAVFNVTSTLIFLRFGGQ